MKSFNILVGAFLALAPVAASAATDYLPGGAAGSISLTGPSGSDSVFTTAGSFPIAEEGSFYAYYYELIADPGSDYDVTVTGSLIDVLAVNIGASVGSAIGYDDTVSETNQPIFTLADFGPSGNELSPAVNIAIPAGSTYYITVAFEQLKEGFVAFDIEWTANSTSSVPLPAALPMLVAALGGMGFVARKRRNRA